MAQLDGQFGPFVYPPDTVISRGGWWIAEEQAYAQQIVAAFTARYPGLKDQALYNGRKAGLAAQYSAEQLQETKAAKRQLMTTFVRCFPGRFDAAVGEASKPVRDRVRRILGHKT